MTLWRIFGRGLLMVSLVGISTRLLAADSGLAVVASGAIQLTWWHNTQSSVRSAHRAAPYVYALGGMTGTALALWIT